MGSYNKWIGLGTITQDVELKHLPSGAAVANVSLAINEVRYKDEQKIESTTFIEVTIWNKSAESLAKHQGKGGQILVEGKLVQETWDDQETGKKRSKLKVVAERVSYISFPKREEGQNAGPNNYEQNMNNAPNPVPAQQGVGIVDVPESDIPF